VSTLYSNSDLEVPFDEEIYPILDPEEELTALLAGKPIVDIAPFSSNYSVRMGTECVCAA
jgi:hypothetical protein